MLVTTANKQEAENIVRDLLESKLIACANIIGPVMSRFRWAGKIDCANEFLILMKSRQDLFETLSAKISNLHSYDVPEILALPVSAGSKSYLSWLVNSLS